MYRNKAVWLSQGTVSPSTKILCWMQGYVGLSELIYKAELFFII